MSKKTWSEVAAILHKVLDKATNEQWEIIDHFGLGISKELPHLVVAAKLRDYLSSALHLPTPVEPSEYALERIKFLNQKRDLKIKPRSNSEAEAWVEYLRLLQRLEHLERIKIEAGDIVEIAQEGQGRRFAEVSSIGEEGRIYFKGGQGAGSWPDLLTVRAKWNDSSPSAVEMRKKAQNCAAQASYLGRWSESKHKELADYEVMDKVTAGDIDQLEQIIDAAQDERPIQKYLGENPHILTFLLGGKTRYCLSQKRLGAEYVPDFLICDTDSMGIRWVLIELETPRSGIYLQAGNELDRYVRKGVNQIMEWREWLASNLDYSRKKRRENGLGLIDIRENSQGFVFVGRRFRLRETKEVIRNQLRDKENIHIHTYDYLLDYLRGAIHHKGPPASNPYLIQPAHTDHEASIYYRGSSGK